MCQPQYVRGADCSCIGRLVFDGTVRVIRVGLVGVGGMISGVHVRIFVLTLKDFIFRRELNGWT